MNWNQLIQDLQAKGVTLEVIASECGFASKGAVHDLKNGAQKTCSYERGQKLIELHAKYKRRKAKERK